MGYASRATNKAYKIPTKLEMASIVLVLNYIKILGHIRIDHKEFVSCLKLQVNQKVMMMIFIISLHLKINLMK